MCGYCCGGTPVEKRGEGHRNCSAECYNAPRRKPARAAETAGPVGLRAAVEALLSECKCSLSYPGFDRMPFTNTAGCLAHGSSGGYYAIRKALTDALAVADDEGES